MTPQHLPPVTQMQATRQQIIVELGCVACLIHSHRLHTQAEIYHQLVDGLPIDHWHTLALCGWHQHGDAPAGQSIDHCRNRRGPSLALDPPAFHERYGTDVELLATQNRFLLRYCMHVGMQDHLAKIITASHEQTPNDAPIDEPGEPE